MATRHRHIRYMIKDRSNKMWAIYYDNSKEKPNLSPIYLHLLNLMHICCQSNHLKTGKTVIFLLKTEQKGRLNSEY